LAAKPTSDATVPDLSSSCLEHAPLPMATLEGTTHIVRYVNPAFCRLIDQAKNDLAGKPFGEILPDKGECLTVLNRVYRTGRSEKYTEQEDSSPPPAFWSYMIWPVTVDKRTVGVVIQVIETTPLHGKMLAMNEALLLGSLRQHKLNAAANVANTQLQTEIGARKQGERDAQMLTIEVSHRIRNSLQIVVGLIGHEAKRTTVPSVEGYEAMKARIGAMAELYDLISRSGRGRTVPVDAYLREITETMSASLLGETSGIKIEVKAEPLDIDSDRALPFGLLVNELVTNAIKHAFPDGTGRVVLSVEQIGGQIELTVADDGVGVKNGESAKTTKTHGADYVAVFVRQLGGTIAVSGSEGTGTIVRIRLPLLLALPRTPNA
jgi:two-component sensor histidine kinase